MNLTGSSMCASGPRPFVRDDSFFARLLCVLAITLVVFALPPSASGALTREPGFVYIASFNIFTFGNVEKRYRNAVRDTDLEELDGPIPDRVSNLAEVLAFGGFDIVSIQEVKHGPEGHAAVTDLVRELKDRHGLDYDFILSGNIGDGFRNMPEAIAFLYRPETVSPEPFDAQGRYWTLVPIAERDLVRTQWEAGNFDFTIYAAHLAYEDRAARRAGFETIARIFERPLAWSHDPDVIVLGDFNRLAEISESCARGGSRCRVGQPPVKALEYNPRSPKFRAPNITAFDHAFSTCPEVVHCRKRGANLPVHDAQLLSTTVSDWNTFAYDAIMFSEDAGEEFPAALHQARYGVDFGIIHFDHPGGVGFQPHAEEPEHHKISRSHTDHRPVWLRFRTDRCSHADD